MLISDLIQSVGVLIQARWAYLGFVETGTACSVQAAMITFGDVATAVWYVEQDSILLGPYFGF